MFWLSGTSVPFLVCLLWFVFWGIASAWAGQFCEMPESPANIFWHFGKDHSVQVTEQGGDQRLLAPAFPFSTPSAFFWCRAERFGQAAASSGPCHHSVWEGSPGVGAAAAVHAVAWALVLRTAAQPTPGSSTSSHCLEWALRIGFVSSAPPPPPTFIQHALSRMHCQVHRGNKPNQRERWENTIPNLKGQIQELRKVLGVTDAFILVGYVDLCSHNTPLPTPRPYLIKARPCCWFCLMFPSPGHLDIMPFPLQWGKHVWG